MKKLTEIQAELKAPKNQFNSFGKYKYRSCEDILEAVKPLLKKHDCTLTITDDVLEVGSLVFIDATAIISDGKESVSVRAQAGIDPNRKGMDIAQSFGSSSSYARKYALNGLFLIDDTKDADATNDHSQTVKEPSKLTLTDAAKDAIVKAVFEGKGTIEQAKGKYSISEKQESAIKAAVQILVNAQG
jgi:hypothetical protein